VYKVTLVLGIKGKKLVCKKKKNKDENPQSKVQGKREKE
jgi:hypothetical protein